MSVEKSISSTGLHKPVRKTLPAAAAQNLILDAAEELFYQEGARAVGVDAVVKRAGVNKMSLYRQFESKDSLLLHYLARRDEKFWAYFNASVNQHPEQPRLQLRQIFVDLAERAAQPKYRGCPFVNVAAEFPEPLHPARQAVAQNKAQLLARLLVIATHTGASDPQTLAYGIAVLIEGAYTASQTYIPNNALLTALPQVAEALIKAACERPNT